MDSQSHLLPQNTVSKYCWVELGGNKIKEIPRDITELEFLQEFFICTCILTQIITRSKCFRKSCW